MSRLTSLCQEFYYGLTPKALRARYVLVFFDLFVISYFIVTTFKVKNLAENAIAGLQVDEFWFDTEGNTVTGDSVRFREPVLIGQVVEIELRVPRNPAMDRSNYEFSHQNGDVRATLLESIEDPEEEQGDEPSNP